MSTVDDPFGPSAALQVLSRRQPLYLPESPIAWALDRIETAISDIRTAGVSGWQSVLADSYRDELDDLAADIARVRTAVLSAESSYAHLRFVAHMNGE